MADDPKPLASAAVVSPQVERQIAGLREKREQLVAKLAQLENTEPHRDHDLPAAKARTQLGIKEVDAELKRLGAK